MILFLEPRNCFNIDFQFSIIKPQGYLCKSKKYRIFSVHLIEAMFQSIYNYLFKLPLRNTGLTEGLRYKHLDCFVLTFLWNYGDADEI